MALLEFIWKTSFNKARIINLELIMCIPKQKLELGGLRNFLCAESFFIDISDIIFNINKQQGRHFY